MSDALVRFRAGAGAAPNAATGADLQAAAAAAVPPPLLSVAWAMSGQNPAKAKARSALEPACGVAGAPAARLAAPVVVFCFLAAAGAFLVEGPAQAKMPLISACLCVHVCAF